MGRTKTQIKAEITTPFMANEKLAIVYGYAVGASFETEFSLVSLENIIFDIVTLAIFIHEQFLNNTKKKLTRNWLTKNRARFLGIEPWHWLFNMGLIY